MIKKTNSTIFFIIFLFTILVTFSPISSAQQNLLDKAYKLIETNPNETISLFDKYLETNPKNISVLKDKAYLLLKIGKKKEAINVFNTILKFAPQEEKVALQLAYLYDELGQKHLAYKTFNNLKNSSDPNISSAARNGLKYLHPWRFFNLGFLTELEIETYNTDFRDMKIFYTRLLTGLRLTTKNPTDIYFNIRHFNQSGLDIGFIPPSFNDTIIVYAFGVRKWLVEKIGLLGYAELGVRNTNLLNIYKEDFSCGVAVYNEWKNKNLLDENKSFELLKFYREANIYAEIGFFSRAEDDFISYLRYTELRNLVFSKITLLDIYGSLISAYDKNGFYYYRYVEGCLGIRILPYKKYKITFFAELTQKHFLDPDKINIPTIPQNFNDKKIGLRAFFSF